MLLVASRFHLPNDVIHLIIEFLPRSAWADERVRCWCNDCNVDDAVSIMHRKLQTNSSERPHSFCTSTYCKACQVAVYKSSDHARKDSGSHRKKCGRPPCRIPGRDENNLCELVDAALKGNPMELMESNEKLKDCEGFESSDDDWESIYSEETEEDTYAQTSTNIIHDFFSRKAYKHQPTRESPFEAMYMRDD